MSIEIFYYQYDGGQDILNCWDSPLSLDGIGIEPKKVIDEYEGKKFVPYTQCPAWSHKNSREFIMYNPKDLTIVINKEGYITVKELSDQQIQKYLKVEDLEPPIKTLQISVPQLLLWTKSKGVWVEARDYPLTSRNNNFTIVNGWFNLSDWCRPISFGINVCDSEQDVKIKRGDPIYKFAFYKEGDLRESFKLTKSVPPQEMLLQMHKRLAVKQFTPFLAKDIIFGEKEKKCPFPWFRK